MLYLFCSAAVPLYKRDALESMSYPPGHIFRFRYDRAYVQPAVLNCLKKYKGKDGVLVFADTVGTIGAMDFSFLPVRRIKTMRLVPAASAIYVDFRLGEFLNYGEGVQRRGEWDRFLKDLPARPWPPLAKSGRPAEQQGYFVLAPVPGLPGMTTESSIPYENWQSVVRHLDSSKDLAESTFYLILGFFRVKRRWFVRPRAEIRIRARDNQFDSIYPVPMGQSVVLKILLSRPTFKYDEPQSTRVLKITASGDAFLGLSKDKVHSESRYNEDRTIIVCKRIFDSALSALSIEESNTQEVRTARVTLLTRIKVPAWVLGTVVLGVVVSTLLLAVDADSLRFVATFLRDPWKGMMESNAKALGAIAKALSPLPVGLSAFLAFKKLPIK
jgi:hypothetical protein